VDVLTMRKYHIIIVVYEFWAMSYGGNYLLFHLTPAKLTDQKAPARVSILTRAILSGKFWRFPC
jgi:hypothetical protein